MRKKGQGKLRAKDYKKKTTAANNRNDITVLAKDIAKVNAKVTKSLHTYQYSKILTDMNLSANYAIINLIAPNTWSPVFADDVNEAEFASCNLRHIKVDGYIDSGNETDSRTNITLMLVKPKEKILRALDTSKELTTLVQNREYTYVNGVALLNPKMFTVKAVRRFSVGPSVDNHGLNTSSTLIGDNIKRFSFSIPINKKIEAANGTISSWKINGGDVKISTRYYLIVFNDNSALDGRYPRLTLNQLAAVAM